MPEIELEHVLALKKYLNVSSQTPNIIVYSETGRYPLFVLIAVKVVKCWLRVVIMFQES